MGEPGARRADLTDPAAGWSALHHGIDPARVPFVRGYLAAVGPMARRLRFVPPTVITAVGVVLALDALLLAGRFPAIALVLVLASTACDALDGAVAVVAGRSTRAGALADRAADRIADTAFALVLWRCGAPWWLAVAAAALSLGLESGRELRGGSWRTRITVCERPSRVICTVLGTVCATVSAATWPVTTCAAVWCALAVIAFAQLTGRPFHRSRPR